MSVKTAVIQTVNGALSAIAENKWAGKAWGIDISRYQETVNIAPGVIDFGIAKLGGSEAGVFLDPKFSDHVQSIYDAQAIPMAYWYVDSSWYTDKQFTVGGVTSQTNDNHPILQTIIRGLRAGNGWKAVKALFLDLETIGSGDVWNALYIEDLRNRIVDLRKTGGFPNIPMGIYSRSGFVNPAPSVRTWVENHPEIIVWTANYLGAFPGYSGPLADVRANRLPLATQNPLWFGDNAKQPKQYKRIWQYHGSFPGGQAVTCPEVLNNQGQPSWLDLNVTEYTPAEMRAEFGAVVVTPPPPPPPAEDPSDLVEIKARVTALEAWARSLPKYE